MAQSPPVRLPRNKPSAGFRTLVFLPVAVPLLATSVEPMSIGASVIWGAVLFAYPEKGQ